MTPVTDRVAATKSASGGALRPEWASGDHGLPVARYIDPEFAKLEAEKLWPRVWQMACRLDEISDPGAYTVYDIIDQSVVVVRVDETTIKAYHNVCPHRGTALASGAGRFQLETVTCPFHGWRWNLRGENTFILSPEEFKGGCLTSEELHLHEVKLAVWMGSVWINLDPEAQPFEDFIAPVRALVDPLLLDQMKFYWHKQIVANANWKVAQEAFMESYHVATTHPQITGAMRAADFNAKSDYLTFDGGHGLFYSPTTGGIGGVAARNAVTMNQAEQAELLIRSLNTVYEGHDSQVHADDVDVARTMRHRQIPEGMSVGEAFQAVLREHFAAQGRPIGTAEALGAVTDMNIFPHIVFLPTFGNLLMYRVRPTRTNDPDWCIFDMYAVRSYPEGVNPPRWKTEICTDTDDPAQMPLIPRQDFINVPRQQRGLHSKAIQSTLLSGRQEKMILNMHRELDRYLSA
jgi:phenylpropionate dioxygenase-like ring-hydroxylating dioxygenase large terminal subunit